jgi:hypothetical protein
MIITGILMIVAAIALIGFLKPKEDVRLIQLELWPKILAILIGIGGLIVLMIGFD